MRFDNLDEYLSFIDSRAPDLLKHYETVEGIRIEINPGVWNPNKGKSSKMFIEVLRDYDLSGVHNALDIGTGSGILALILWKRGVRDILAVDNMEEAVENAVYNFRINNAQIEVRKSDLFSDVDGCYDLILFNAPAIHPKRRNVPRLMWPLWSLEENIAMRFLRELKDYLTENGRALLMYSRFPDYDPIPESKLDDMPFSYTYLTRDNSSLSESGIIEFRLKER